LGGVLSGEVLLGEVLSEGLLESIGLVEPVADESDGGEATLPEEPRSPLLVSLVSVVVVLEDPSEAFLCFLLVVVDEVSPWMPVDVLLLSLLGGSAELSLVLGVDVVVVVCWSVVVLGLFESWARAPNAVKPRASAVIAIYFMPSPWRLFGVQRS
jgi:hypothetical protein